MRNWEIRANGPCDDCGWSEPYEAGYDIRRFLEVHQDTTESDIEQIAKRYHCSVHWTMQPHTVSQELEDLGLAQIQLSAPNDQDPYPRPTVNGEGLYAGMTVTALFPSGWQDITLEISFTDPACWYISTPGFEDISPIGLFIKW